MREKTCNQKSKNKLFALRGFGLILAFVVVFALVLGFGVYDGSITTDSTNQVAMAGGSDPVNTNHNSVVTFETNGLTDITAASLGYPGASSKTSFSTGDMSTSNTSFATQSNISYSYKAVGNPDAPTPSFNANDGEYKLEYDAAEGNRYEYGWSVVNFNVTANPIFTKLLYSSAISKVEATVKGTYSSYSQDVGFAGTNGKFYYTYGYDENGKKAADFNYGDDPSGLKTN